MEEKKQSMASFGIFADKMRERADQNTTTAWSKTTKIKAGIRVKTIDRPLNLWGRIKQRLYTKWVFPRLLLHSQDHLWSILDGGFCKLLPLLNSSDTYKPYPQQELQIVSVHQELSKSECIGSVEVYHKEQLISQVQWHLKLSNGRATLEVTCPFAIRSLLNHALQDWYILIKTPSSSKYFVCQ